MNFFRIALSLYRIETFFYARVANGKAEKSQLNVFYCILTITPLQELLKSNVIMIKRVKILEAEHELGTNNTHLELENSLLYIVFSVSI